MKCARLLILNFSLPGLNADAQNFWGSKMSLLKEIREAEKKGRESARNGALASSNPHSDRLELHSAWLRGYRDAWSEATSKPARQGGGNPVRDRPA